MKSSRRSQTRNVSRRSILKFLSSAPFLFRPAPIYPLYLQEASKRPHPNELSLDDIRLSPLYPADSPLSDIFRTIQPGSDDYPLERFAVEIEALLNEWGESLKRRHGDSTDPAPFLDALIDASDPANPNQTVLRSGFGIDAVRRAYSEPRKFSRERFLKSLASWLEPATSIETTEFEIFNIEQVAATPLTVRIDVRYDIVNTHRDQKREERVGTWKMEWSRNGAESWKAHSWHFTGETVCTAQSPAFIDITDKVLGSIDSYRSQLSHGADYWRTILDGAIGIDIYGNNGVATGDFDGDGFDDLYICQSAGLPNRLYRNRGDGTFEDVTEKAGVGVLDRTACALFADFLNRGRQDLLVVCGTGPILFLNNGDGTFSLKRDAFKFARPPQGSFTHAAIADYDNDGRLDVYFCLYMYYLGLEQYNYPVPYYDARNGPPNCLFRNNGDGTFTDATETSGLAVNNDRYSFACAWGDSTGKGSLDLFVANDFGSSQLYRNNGNGTFTDVSKEAHIESVGAGMGCCWADFDNDGHQDIYIPSMWEAAGQRISAQPQFHREAPDSTRELYRRHARGNVLYRNRGNGQFENVGHCAAVEMGRWSWSSDFWDWDHDGYSDLYVTNGYLSSPRNDELAGFFWRQVVAKSPEDTTPLTAYERGWNAINELIRSDYTWHGHARNVAFANNRDGTFTETSGAVLLDSSEDSRAFALADFDHDGRLEVVLKNRNAPQVRVFHNALSQIGSSISFRLRGTKSNRDAIGASITVIAGELTQTKYLQAGSGFLSQHTKELFFGLGTHHGAIKATIRWPSGTSQTFANLPVANRILLEEGNSNFRAEAFSSGKETVHSRPAEFDEKLPGNSETWLVQPLRAPTFKLNDLAGVQHTLESLRGAPILLTFWSVSSKESLRFLDEFKSGSTQADELKIIAINLDDSTRVSEARKSAIRYEAAATVLFTTTEVAGIYNLLYRNLFDRQRDMPIPLSLLLDREGMIVKVYQGFASSSRLHSDSTSIPVDKQTSIRRALPFPGLLIQDDFARNDFTYGVALYQHGFLDQASESFQQVIATKPDNSDAYYNLGTLNLRRNRLDEAKGFLQKTVELRPNFAEAWNNLGMLAAQQGHSDEAIRNFQQSIDIRPNYFTAHLNLGNLYRRQRAFDKAHDSLSRALSLRPDDPDVQYSLGMLFAQQNELAQAAQYLERAIALRPVYPEALNNLGVLHVRQQNVSKAEEEFKTAIAVAPAYDQSYLNLARLYAMQADRQKARDVLQQLLKIQPGNTSARDALTVLQSAQ
ncbi:MAG: VCBS repeat-containing protein [Acidobacteria bacterium]|nr:VCBS repeat-containing protein [Acidobacteriota bacterium]